MRRLPLFLIVAFVPVLILSAFFPDRLMKGQETEEHYSSTKGADIVVFVRDGCPHCAAFEKYSASQGWDIEFHEITDLGAPELFERLQERSPNLSQGVPTIIVDGNIIQGYETDEKTGETIRKLYDDCKSRKEGCSPFRDFLASSKSVEVRSAAEATCTGSCEMDLGKYVWDFPVIGQVDLTLLSLPVLSLFLGFLDGFNPCAMWVLITLLTLLLSTNDMRKVWIVGGTFLFVSGLVYYLFIAAWLNVFLLIGVNAWVQKIIGIVAIGGGGFYLYEALGKDPNACAVTDFARRKRTIDRMHSLLQKTAWPAMILGVAVLAVSVNMIELVCTAGLPAIFTQILAFNAVSTAARYGYLALYIMMYMIDDLVIFAIAVFSLHATGLTTKYRRLTLIVGGVLMYILGLLLIFAPEALTFS